eukprot:11927289-Heterocapsa_arctica.AAC.1
MVWTSRKCSKAEQAASVVDSDRNWVVDAVGFQGADSLRRRHRALGGANVITSDLHGVPVRRRRRA